MRVLSKAQLETWIPFMAWLPKCNKNTLTADFWAGLTGAIIVLPQGIAYAMIAGLPPQYGLYTAIVPAIIAAMFGSSHHLISGPTAALSVIVFTTISQYAAPGTPLYIQLCLTLTFCAGIVQVLFGLMRFGALVNFVSHSVVLGFTAGAAVVIGVSQLKHVLGLAYPSEQTAWLNLQQFFSHISEFQFNELMIAVITIVTCIAVKRFLPRLPHMLIAMLIAMAFAFVFTSIGKEVALVGDVGEVMLSASVPHLGMSEIESMLAGIFAVAILGLVEAISISRSVALKSRQRLDSNQEFVGQGLSNVIGAFFSCYMSSGSFTRSGVNYSSGAKTPLAAVFAAVLLLVIMMVGGQYASYIPNAGMAGLLLIVAWNLVDLHHIKELLNHDLKEAFVLGSTFFAALILHLELSIYVGVFVSLFFYLRRTSKPAVEQVEHRDLIEGLDRDTQIVRVNGSIFYGCVQHLHQELESLNGKRLIILGRGINFIDHLGVQMLDDFIESSQKEVYFCRFKRGPKSALLKSGQHIHETHFSERLTPLLDSIIKR
ncbi:SulP family inorganic anion transporter [Vibrio sonorensis]|uniref:SulP family inorganic anion transporter n=1 Tax=Vibrio sonorensis TaxID=1004316 RepID=UPI0008D9AD0B|nr:SulP family inorganic anion transporter [Vibrio sonorensis]